MQQSAYAATKPLTVSQAMALAKEALESVTITLVGEVSEVSIKRGYKAAYFTVKDEGASMPCMMWMNRYRNAGTELRIGQLVQLTGRFTLYAPKGRMNFDVFALAEAGEGDLRKQVADLARKLQREGLMAQDHKRPVPYMPRKIGLVTSPRGAAVHDVLRTLRRRYPLAEVLLAGVPVEGKVAPAALMSGMKAVVDAGAQVVLLVRGGGSFEDLMPFNDERLARTIYRCPVPVITGIGHEPDTSIADMVADVRASTPTGAAEAAAPDMREIALKLDESTNDLLGAIDARLNELRRELGHRASRPVLANPKDLFMNEQRALGDREGRLHRAIPVGLARDRDGLGQQSRRLQVLGSAIVPQRRALYDEAVRRLGVSAAASLSAYGQALRLAAARLNDLSPLAVIERGYALAYDAAGGIVRSVQQVPAGSQVTIHVKDGVVHARVTDTERNTDPMEEDNDR